MSEFKPVSTLAELNTLDEAEILEGYRDGLDDQPEPGNNRSKAYWHGWRNGMIDRGRLPMDSAAAKLADEFIRRKRPTN